MKKKAILIDDDFLTHRQFNTYEIIVKKMQVNWRYQLTIIIVGLGFIYQPEKSEELLKFLKIPADSFLVFSAYILPISFIYFGFFLGRYINARTSIEYMLLNGKYVPNRHEATKLTDGLFIFDITHRFVALKLPIVAKLTHAIACLFVIAVITCNHVLSFKFALEADLFSITTRYISNTLMCCAIILCYSHFIIQLPSLITELPNRKGASIIKTMEVSRLNSQSKLQRYSDKFFLYKVFCLLSILFTAMSLYLIYW